MAPCVGKQQRGLPSRHMGVGGSVRISIRGVEPSEISAAVSAGAGEIAICRSKCC